MTSFNMMTGQGEGIYASPTSTDVGLQQKDEVGLTYFAKIRSQCKLPLDTCKITHQDFRNALQLFEPLLAEQEQRPPPFPAESIYSTHRHYVAASKKRKELSRDVHQPSPQKLPSAPAIWPESPAIGLAPPEPVTFHYGTQTHGNGTLRKDTLELCFPVAVGSTNGTREMQKNIESASLTTCGKAESVEANNIRSGASEISQKKPVNCGEIFTFASDSSDQYKNIKGLDNRFHHDPHSDICKDGFESTKSAGATNLYQYKGLWDPDLPLNSVENENEDLSVSCQRDNYKSRSSGIPECAIYGVPKGLPSSLCQTVANVDSDAAQEAANEATRKLVLSQHAPVPSRKLSQTSTLVSIAKLFLQKSLKASSEGYSKALSSHQIPAELRQYFQALLRKFQTDEQFQKSVITYAMEQTGAVSPEKDSKGLMPLRLRQGFDAVRNRCHEDEKFKMSVEKYVMEYLNDVKDIEDPGIFECDVDELPEKVKPHPNLDGLSKQALINYCRILEKRWSGWALSARKQREKNRPKDPNPQPGDWTCYRPKTTGNLRKTIRDCGGKTPFYSAECVWVANTNCSKCKAPYDETLVSHKTKIGSKSQTNQTRSASPAIQVTPGPLVTDQLNAQANAQACVQDYNAMSSPPDYPNGAQLNDFGASPTVRGDLLSDASTVHLYGAVSENDNPDLRSPSPGWHTGNNSVPQTPISDQFHPTPVGSSPWNVHGGMADYLPRQMSSSQTPSIGYMDALQFDMDFTGEDGEFDEFALQLGSF